jgi:hypothetical protein
MRRKKILSICFVIIPFLAACSGLPKTGGGGPQQVTVTVTPATPTVNNFATQQFTAAVTGTTNTAVTWQVNGVAGGSQATGFISSSGLFVAPGAVPTKSDGSGNSVPTTVTVTAVSQANTAVSKSATVTIAPQNQNIQSGAIKLGTSGGNANAFSTSGTTITCCGGTLGSLVTRNGAQFILSNNHVIANSDTAQLGDPIIQPALIDNPSPSKPTCTATGTTTVANLTAFFNLESDPAPKVDAAIAQIVNGKVDPLGNILYLGATATNGIPDPGPPHAGSGVAATVSMAVAKSGRTTGLTCSSVLATNTTTSVLYHKGCGASATFSVSYTNLVDVVGGQFSSEGDSGSLIVTQNTADAVALLFAGSDQDAIGNPISTVLNTSKFLGAGNAVPTVVGGATHPVIGCTLPAKPAGAVQTLAASAVASEALQKATVARDAHAPELLAHPEVQAVGVGASYDNPAEAAILFFVTKGQPRTNIPLQVDGIRTRIIEGDLFVSRGALSAEESAALEKTAAPPQLVYSISDSEVARARVVHTAHADELLKRPGVQGIGISSSVDSPGEAALIIFLIRGEAHDPISPVIEGLRTRVRESSRFRAGFGDALPHRACSLPITKNGKGTGSAAPRSTQ